MPVIQCPGASNNARHVDKGVYSQALFRADDLHPESDIAGEALHITEPIQLFLGGSEPNAAASMPAGGLASHMFKGWIGSVMWRASPDQGIRLWAQ